MAQNLMLFDKHDVAIEKLKFLYDYSGGITIERLKHDLEDNQLEANAFHQKTDNFLYRNRRDLIL